MKTLKPKLNEVITKQHILLMQYLEDFIFYSLLLHTKQKKTINLLIRTNFLTSSDLVSRNIVEGNFIFITFLGCICIITHFQ